MGNPTNTELKWKLEATERKVAALTDMLAFMVAHLAATFPQRAGQLSSELLDLRQIDDAQWVPEFQALIDRMRLALDPDQEGLQLDSMK